ncbi:MAG: DUF3579 domain-containing protein [Betaproteobacteria bacterium]|nr:DUF3579 domain-containing protein [Betaproteobacteria bacterium]
MGSAGLDVVIWGITREGRTFRPSDWAERLAGLTSAFGHDQKLSYSPFVRPVAIRGVKAVIVGQTLEALEPRLYHFLLNFARDNELQTAFASGAISARSRRRGEGGAAASRANRSERLRAGQQKGAGEAPQGTAETARRG